MRDLPALLREVLGFAADAFDGLSGTTSAMAHAPKAPIRASQSLPPVMLHSNKIYV